MTELARLRLIETAARDLLPTLESYSDDIDLIDFRAALRATPVADTAGIELWQRMDAEWRRLRRLEAAGTMEAVRMNELAETFRPLLSWAEAVSQHHAMLRTEPPFTSTKKLKDALASAYVALRVTPVADTAGIDAALFFEPCREFDKPFTCYTNDDTGLWCDSCRERRRVVLLADTAGIDAARLAEAMHLVRNHAFDNSTRLHREGNTHPLGDALVAEAVAIAREYAAALSHPQARGRAMTQDESGVAAILHDNGFTWDDANAVESIFSHFGLIVSRHALVRTPETLDTTQGNDGSGHRHIGGYCVERGCLIHVRAATPSPTPPEGLRAPYGGHPEFGPRVMANQAQPSIAGWESLAKDALLAFDQARAALAASPAPDPGAGPRGAAEGNWEYANRDGIYTAPSAEPPETET